MRQTIFRWKGQIRHGCGFKIGFYKEVLMGFMKDFISSAARWSLGHVEML